LDVEKSTLDLPISPNSKPSQRRAERIISEFLHDSNFAPEYYKTCPPINLAIIILIRAYDQSNVGIKPLTECLKQKFYLSNPIFKNMLNL